VASHLGKSSFSALGSITVFWKCAIFQMPSRFTIVNEPLVFAAPIHEKRGSGDDPKCMVATATATSGAIDRIVADSTLMVVFAVWAYGMTTGRVQRLHAPA
jgi:hypothetical protein